MDFTNFPSAAALTNASVCPFNVPLDEESLASPPSTSPPPPYHLPVGLRAETVSMRDCPVRSFDRQLCKVWTGLYSLDETQITMGWRPGVEPIINWRMDLAEWEVSYVEGSKKVMDFEGFNHSYALAVIDLQRKPNYYVKYGATDAFPHGVPGCLPPSRP